MAREFLVQNLGEAIINLNLSEVKASKICEFVIDIYNKRHLNEQYRKDWRDF
jgi:hypothetical protein